MTGTDLLYIDKKGSIQSCGCYSKQIKKNIKHQAKRTHGLSRVKNNKAYRTWRNVKNRTLNKNYRDYSRYGGRGIRICDRWRNSFQFFYDDMGEPPSPNHSIDRIDNNKHYSCGKCEQCTENHWSTNCRWATVEQQANNRGDNMLLTFKGKTQNATQWANETDIPRRAIYQRINNYGWSVNKALSTPVQSKIKL